MPHRRSFLAVMTLSAFSTTTGAANAGRAFLFERAEPSEASSTTTSRKATSTTTAAAKQESSAAKSPASASRAASSTRKFSSAAASRSAGKVYSQDGISTYSATASHGTSPSPTSTLSSQVANKGSTGLSVGVIVGIAVGGTVLLCLIAALLASRRRKKREQLYKTRMIKPDPFTLGFGSHDPAPPLKVSAPQVSFSTSPTTPMVQMPPVTLASPTLSPPASPPTTVTTTAALVPSSNKNRSIGVFTVVSTYIPTLSDELDIQTGDRVEIFIEYDDGWCQGVNLSRGAVKGVFPKHCVDYYQNQQDQLRSPANMKRVSSMYMSQTSYYM